VEVGNVVWIGVDPGDVTGVSILDANNFYRTFELSATDITSFLRDVTSLVGFKIYIGCERYTERGNKRKTHQPLAQRITGVVLALGHPVTMVPPSTAKKMCNDTRLRQLGWYVKTKDGHSNDAGRVLFATIALVSPSMVKDLLDLR
jgi:hypothetical protein